MNIIVDVLSVVFWIFVVLVVAVLLFMPVRKTERRPYKPANFAPDRFPRVRVPPEVLDDQYRCESCGKVFDKGRPDAEAMAAALEVFGKAALSVEPPAIVCDDCYQIIMGDHPMLMPSAECIDSGAPAYWEAAFEAAVRAGRVPGDLVPPELFEPGIGSAPRVTKKAKPMPPPEDIQ